MTIATAARQKQWLWDKLILELLVWLSASAFLVWWLLTATNDDERTQATILAGALSIVFGVQAFIRHGRGRITVTGLFNLSTALFIGYAGIVVATSEDYALRPHYLGIAVAGGLVTQIGTTVLAWGTNGTKVIPLSLAKRKTANWAARAGSLALIAVASASAGAPEVLGPYAESAAFVAISLLTVGLLWRKGARLVSWSTILIIATLVIYAEYFHSGQGRLRIVALACVIGILYAVRFQRRTVKYAFVTLIPVALIWLAADRRELQESLTAGASEGRSGLESMLSPTVVFAQLLEHQANGFPLSYGYNLLSFPALLVPEGIWPNRPQALGYELVRITEPEKYGSGFSVVASSAGEAVYNFGMLGFLLVIPVVAIILRIIDRQFVYRVSIAKATSLGLLGIVFWAMFAGSIADFAWSGQHTYLARIATRIPLLAVIAALAMMRYSFAARPSLNSQKVVTRAQ